MNYMSIISKRKSPLEKDCELVDCQSPVFNRYGLEWLTSFISMYIVDFEKNDLVEFFKCRLSVDHFYVLRVVYYSLF